MFPRRALALLLALAPSGALAACTPTVVTCVAPGVTVGGQARIPVAIAQAGATEPLAREVAVAKGDVFLADAAGRALPGVTVQTSADGTYQLNRIPAGQATMVAVRAKTASGASVVLKGLARVGAQGATAEVNAATTIATLALLEGQREAIGDFDQASYDKLVAKVYQRLAAVTALDLNDDPAVIALFKGWMAQDPEMRALYDRLRGEVTRPSGTLAERLKALEQAQGHATGGQLPARPGSPTPQPPDGATAAPSASPDAGPSPVPTASGTPAVLAGDVTTIAGQEAGFADGEGVAARFNGPGGLAFDPAASEPTLYVADTNNNRIRRVVLTDPARPRVSTVAGSGTAGARDGAGAGAEFNRPIGLAFGSDGALLVADSLGRSVRRVDVRTTAFPVSTVTTGGAAQRFTLPTGVAVDPGSGAAYVTDAGDHAVRRIATGAAGPIVSRLTGGDPGPAAGLLAPAGVAIDPNGFLWVADAGKGLIRSVAADGTVATFAGRYEAPAPGEEALPGYAEGQGTDAVFARPTGLARHPAGFLVVADAGNNRVRALDASGRTTLIAGGGAAGHANGRASAATFDRPSWVAVAPDGSIYVADTGNHRLRRIS